MKYSSLFVAGSFLSLALLSVGCGDGGDDTDGTGGAASGGASTGGTSSGGGSSSGGASGGGTMSGGGGTGGGASLTCSPQGGVRPISEDCGGSDSSFELREPLSNGASVAVYVWTELGGNITVSLENDACAEEATVIHTGVAATGANCYDLVSPGEFSRLRIRAESGGGLSYQLCPQGACTTN